MWVAAKIPMKKQRGVGEHEGPGHREPGEGLPRTRCPAPEEAVSQRRQMTLVRLVGSSVSKLVNFVEAAH